MLDLPTLALFTAAAAVLTATPGPDMLLIASRSLSQGRMAGLLTYAGIAIGSYLQAFAAAFGLSQLFLLVPTAYDVLRWLGAAYLAYLAWKIARSGAMGAESAASEPFGFVDMAAFQWINPKAWMMALGALSAYSAGAGGALTVALIFTAVNLPSVAIWAAMGQGLRGVLQEPGRLLLFNRAMAVLLVVSMLPVLSGH